MVVMEVVAVVRTSRCHIRSSPMQPRSGSQTWRIANDPSVTKGDFGKGDAMEQASVDCQRFLRPALRPSLHSAQRAHFKQPPAF